MPNSPALGRAIPGAYQSLLAMGKAATTAALNAGIDPKTIELIRIRASQLNGCAYCLRMHTRDAIAQGEDSDRLAVVSAWRDTAYFTRLERAALAATEEMTLIADIQNGRRFETSDDADLLTQDQLAAVQWLTIAINAWNRVAIFSRLDVAPPN